MLKVTAVSISNGGNDIIGIDIRLKLHFGNLWELFSDGIDVLRFRRSNLMKIDLLKKVSVLGRSLSFSWVTRVENALAILAPGRATAAGQKGQLSQVCVSCSGMPASR